eukprot:jgi/Undpi1/5583/HiC_scaffold_2.g00859.m1
MPPRKGKVWSSGRRSVALSIVAAGLATLLSPALAANRESRNNRALEGLDLVEDLSTETIKSMKADMSVNFLEAVLLEATVSLSGGGGDAGGAGLGLGIPMIRGDCSTPGVGDCSWPAYSLTDKDGVVHTCTVREDPPEKRAAAKKKSSGKDVATALDPLEGRCATVAHEYWSYKWCHRGEVTQFHDNNDGTTTKVFLGKHARTEVKRARTSLAKPEEAGESWISRVLQKKRRKKEKAASNSSGRRSKKSDPYEGITDFSEVAAVFDFYEGGDRCDDTNEYRKVRTAITCCATKLEEADGTYSPMAVLVSIQEVSVCSYLVQVCSRLLCPTLGEDHAPSANSARAISGGQPSSSGAAKSSVVPNAGGVLGILEELDTCFPVRHETWWSYRLCFSTGISQYHAELSSKLDKKGSGIVTVSVAFRKWDKSTVTGQGDDLIHQSEEGTGESVIVLEFTGGSECDLTGVLRSTTVHLKCANMQGIREVVEDRTCHYRIVASSPLLCRSIAETVNGWIGMLLSVLGLSPAPAPKSVSIWEKLWHRASKLFVNTPVEFIPEVLDRIRLLEASAAALIQQEERDAVHVAPVTINVEKQPAQACDLDLVCVATPFVPGYGVDGADGPPPASEPRFADMLHRLMILEGEIRWLGTVARSRQDGRSSVPAAE